MNVKKNTLWERKGDNLKVITSLFIFFNELFS